MQNARSSLCRKNQTIFMKKLGSILLNAKKWIYECGKQIPMYNKHDVQGADFIIVEMDFINVEKQIRSFWNSKKKRHSNLAFWLEKNGFTRCFMRK